MPVMSALMSRASLRLPTSSGIPMKRSNTDWSTFYSQLHGFGAARVRGASDVDDLVHLVLERAMEKATRTEIDNIAGWLFGIARNAIADHYRGQARTLIA